MQTTLQRCPLNSVEQLGQIEETSFFTFAETRFGAKRVAVSTALGAVESPDERLVESGIEFSVELISGVVAHIQSRENRNAPDQETTDDAQAGAYSYLNASAGKIRAADHDG